MKGRRKMQRKPAKLRRKNNQRREDGGRRRSVYQGDEMDRLGSDGWKGGGNVWVSGFSSSALLQLMVANILLNLHGQKLTCLELTSSCFHPHRSNISSRMNAGMFWWRRFLTKLLQHWRFTLVNSLIFQIQLKS